MNVSTRASAFLSMHLMNLMHALTCPLLWWWYTDDTAYSMLKLLQNFLNLSETKLVPASDIILCGNPYSANMTFVVVIRLHWYPPPSSLLLGICCGNLLYTNNFYYWSEICLHLALPMASGACHGVSSSSWAVSAEMWRVTIFYMLVYVCININPIYGFMHE